MQTVVLVINLLLNFWLLTIVHRQHVRRQLPWFALYVAWQVLLGIAALVGWLIGHELYRALYWWTEGIGIVLIVATVRESFLNLFQGFTSKQGFRWSVWTVIACVVLYSAWKALYAPPLHNNRLDAFIFGAEFLFRWAIFGIAFLAIILSFLLTESPERRELAVVTGFGISSAGFLVYVIGFSLFGVQYAFLTKFAPSVGYFLAAGWWIWVFSQPIQEFGLEELGMTPEDVRKEMDRYRDFGERL
jgi:hypothetical protein